MNNAVVAGNVGQSELKYLASGDPVLTFSVADSQGKDKGAIWWNCSLFGKRAESLAQYIVKGTPVTATGTLSLRSYENKQGVNVTNLELRVNDVALQGGKRDDQGGNRRQSSNDFDDLPFN